VTFLPPRPIRQRTNELFSCRGSFYPNFDAGQLLQQHGCRRCSLVSVADLECLNLIELLIRQFFGDVCLTKPAKAPGVFRILTAVERTKSFLTYKCHFVPTNRSSLQRILKYFFAVNLSSILQWQRGRNLIDISFADTLQTNNLSWSYNLLLGQVAA
jgi:hypothetical protein